VQGPRYRSYYYASGQRVAVRVSGDATLANNGLFYLLTDHLGSTSITANGTTGALVSEMRYKPWGETRWSSGTTPTSKHFTGQIEDAGIGLYFYGSRFYDPAVGRFLQPDTIVPGAGNPQNLNRFSYTLNNPIKYNDPSGHCPWCVVTAAIGAAVGVGLYEWNISRSGQQRDLGQEITVGLVGAGAGALIGTGVGAGVGTAAFAAIATSAGLGMATSGIGYLEQIPSGLMV
jgi:RHS repeat-associated protein